MDDTIEPDLNRSAKPKTGIAIRVGLRGSLLARRSPARP